MNEITKIQTVRKNVFCFNQHGVLQWISPNPMFNTNDNDYIEKKSLSHLQFFSACGFLKTGLMKSSCSRSRDFGQGSTASPAKF